MATYVSNGQNTAIKIEAIDHMEILSNILTLSTTEKSMEIAVDDSVDTTIVGKALKWGLDDRISGNIINLFTLLKFTVKKEAFLSDGDYEGHNNFLDDYDTSGF